MPEEFDYSTNSKDYVHLEFRTDLNQATGEYIVSVRAKNIFTEKTANVIGSHLQKFAEQYAQLMQSHQK